ncbi:uncharacterized protein TRAVEDRAFT_104808, partial [Trametes versicolor FP-101664 SS1]|uniref:uncharacterized protein n=1 Tax=Trametes versicolor (strain FP-101664) TaxID=717944 RepID=UPI0004622287
MPVRWNTTYAEIERALLLRPAINAWIEQMEKGLTGQKKAAATRKKKRLYLSPQDWEHLIAVRDTLSVLNEVTHLLSKGGVPTIPMTLPLYKHIETKLKSYKQKFRRPEEARLRMGCEKALEKLETYTDIALQSKYVLIGAVLHPLTRIKYFENRDLWDPIVPVRARRLLEELFKEYTEKAATESAHSKHPKPTPDEQYQSAFGASVAAGRGDMAGDSGDPALESLSELDAYFRDTYPCKKEHGALEWWKV